MSLTETLTVISDGNIEDPLTSKKEKEDVDKDEWIKAMNLELEYILRFNSKVQTFKVRLVAKGYTQVEGVDCEETFSPVAMSKSIRILFSIATYYDYEIWQMDVKTAFLNDNLDENIYMQRLEGVITSDLSLLFRQKKWEVERKYGNVGKITHSSRFCPHLSIHVSPSSSASRPSSPSNVVEGSQQSSALVVHLHLCVASIVAMFKELPSMPIVSSRTVVVDQPHPHGSRTRRSRTQLALHVTSVVEACSARVEPRLSEPRVPMQAVVLLVLAIRFVPAWVSFGITTFYDCIVRRDHQSSRGRDKGKGKLANDKK
ncbi:gag/pol protein [Cucumis melo var. makuwa]|uniref:Gag/pol protein n=1 Tax=Cucumis melo var. makuwa TaxID=1194695 RepID=A0A5A7V4C7_CUCMM|nr:gag/pol protein [Cucumis melo var. makuwa]TYK27444.1 gag/pol protein [Cucumis melo var. makuwa]